ncbi:hypothetical protein [Cohnella yongneupensis]|uniref:Secreted protein n=1 Tax=Cohnella yongneupensis TaxID=425006 RepID=A0ABW0R0G7_9BACL
MKRRWMYRMTVGLIVPAFLIGGVVGVTPRDARAESVSVAVPEDVAPNSIFNPAHLYLDSGTCGIAAQSGSVILSASTSANTVVDSIGITVYVQKWNGSAWETYGSGSTLGGNNLAYYSNSVLKSVTPGYYYRTRSIHWVIENGVYEEGEKFSASVLVS